jgi:hypothetical protein
MSKATAERVEIDNIAQFGELIGGLTSAQAIALGTLRSGLPNKVNIATKEAINGNVGPNVVARTASNIIFRQGPGLAFIDFDGKGMPNEIKARLDELGGCWPALLAVLPCLRGVGRATRASTSAGLYRIDTGERLVGSNGQHIYLTVEDDLDVGRFVTTLHDRCWLAGFGWMMVGKAGQLLNRSIVDRMVGASERLVFEGAPSLVPPLEQDQEARRPVISEGDVLDTLSACPPLTVVEKARLDELHAKAINQLAGECAKARAAFINQQVERVVKRSGISRSAAKEIVAKQCDGVLLPHIELEFDNSDLAGKTVADVLADPAHFEGETLADPLEGIDYGRCKARVMLRPDGCPWIHSFAHGRAVYELRFDASAVCASIDAVADEEVIPTFVRLALQASLNAIELEALIARVKERTGRGIRAIAKTLNQAKENRDTEQAEAERKRRIAERNDPRPTIPAANPDAPWLPEMAVYNEVLAKAEDDVPPTRDISGDASMIRKLEIPDTHAFVPSEGE